jgi:hypothetical protein
MKKVLKVVSLLMALCLMVSVFAACGSNSTKEAEKQAASTTEQKAEKKLKIGVIYLTAEHPY